ncbi:hypothetical protein ACH347_30005 [Saccharopolyspora sp. 5N102]|uniref:hypothetical protein n=1 Tax=Saccharopolyspora sp. 5N102 TaxID=3375155 RepID=UPI00378B28C0
MEPSTADVFYVVARNGFRVAHLAGSFASQEDASLYAEPAQVAAEARSQWAFLDEVEVQRVKAVPGEQLRPGKFNERLQLPPDPREL